jgi:GTPase SAR1 family protein
MLIALVGNKTDLLELREVLTEEATHYANEYELLYFETSARLGTHVNQVFTEIGTYTYLHPSVHVFLLTLTFYKCS